MINRSLDQSPSKFDIYCISNVLNIIHLVDHNETSKLRNHIRQIQACKLQRF
jgi:hypothetical protein